MTSIVARWLDHRGIQPSDPKSSCAGSLDEFASGFGLFAVASAMVISMVVFPSASENQTVTRKQWRTIFAATVIIDQFAVFFDFMVNRQVWIVGAIGTMHRVLPDASYAQILVMSR